MALSVAQLVACSHTQPVIGWHNLSLPLIGWHSCQLSVSIPALPPAQASTLHMLSSILLVGATGTNLPSHFVQKIKSVHYVDGWVRSRWWLGFSKYFVLIAHRSFSVSISKFCGLCMWIVHSFILLSYLPLFQSSIFRQPVYFQHS